MKPRNRTVSGDLTSKSKTDGWIAARAYGDARDSYAQAIYAHTSPVQIGTGRPPGIAQESAAFFCALN